MCQLQTTTFFFTERGNALFHVTYVRAGKRNKRDTRNLRDSGEYTYVPNVMSNVSRVLSQNWHSKKLILL